MNEGQDGARENDPLFKISTMKEILMFLRLDSALLVE